MGILLGEKEIEIANKVMFIINKIISENPGIKYWVCPKCRGTGLSSRQGELSWDGMFCDECRGYSKRLERSATYSPCTVCSGKGRVNGELCPKCDGYGNLDWLENITGMRNKK